MPAPMPPTDTQDMPFLEHLEAFRWHVIRSLLAVLVLTVVAFVAKHVLFHTLLLAPSRPDFLTYRLLCLLGEKVHIRAFCLETLPFLIQSRRMTGQFTMHVAASCAAGFVLAFPYVFWEIWRFIKPGLRVRERAVVHGTTFVVSMFFFLGIVFGYFVLAPLSVYFLAHYNIDPAVVNEFDIVSYISTVVLLCLSSGLIFQLPVVIYFLTKIGLVSPPLLRQYRKHAIIVIMVLSALITPPDPFSQALVAIPLVFLYQGGIFISRWVYKKKQTQESPPFKANTT